MKDMIGNDLKEGDFVLCDLSQMYVMGRIVQLKPGGLSLVGGPPNARTPDVIVITSEFAVSPPFNTRVKKLTEPNRIPEGN